MPNKYSDETLNTMHQPLQQKTKFLLPLFIFLLASSTLLAQSTITGKVIAAEDQSPLPGVNIIVKGTANGTITDSEGNYSITPTSSSDILVFSFVGYNLQEVAPEGRTIIDINLTSDARQLSEVVVTALGIKREEKSLGFAAQTVNENAVKDAKSNNWVNTLSGKVAGLNIQGAGAGPMGSSRITFRGESSLNLDNNQALIVVDGVPVSSQITGTGYSSHLSADSPVDYGSSLSDINPDDIEKVTVLKGPGATACMVAVPLAVRSLLRQNQVYEKTTASASPSTPTSAWSR